MKIRDKRKVVAVSGPAGSGKSLCAEVARQIGFGLLETGAIYRAVTLLVFKLGIDPYDVENVTRFVSCNFGRISFWNGQITLDGQLLHNEIRSPKVNAFVADIAEIPAIRKLVLPLQRGFGEEEGLDIVAEGRDIGSVVFPDAWVKIYLDADLKVRAQRRLVQYQKNPEYVGTLDDVVAELNKRDLKDMTRTESPLMRHSDDIYIDSTFMSPDEVIDKMVKICRVPVVA